MSINIGNMLSDWAESLQLLQPKNLTQLGQVTLKTWLELWRGLIISFWWLIAAGMVIFAASNCWITRIVLLIVWLILVILLVRPSLQPKDLAYLGQYALYGLPLVLLFLISCCIPWIGIALLAPYTILAIFFLCDADFKLPSILAAPVQAFHMSWIKLPIYLLFSLMLYLSTWLSPLLNTVVVLPLIISALSRCYVLWLHKNYKEYYDGVC